ncbi:condensation domain-containing protein [Streptomyces sp. NPDC000659]|uniref:condensation domain-containing protein n=1 Tax=Streptomyces sp. NPDC000659 TaxID=3154367 RepID=UPI00332536F0
MSVGSEQAGPPAHAGPARSGPGLPASARQRDVLLDAMAARPGSGPHVGQLHWRWYGPLDTRRFQAAWQCVYDREAVLRAAFAPYGARGGPRVVVHRRVVPRPVRHPYGSADWQALLAAERRRGFDPTRPGLLRIALLDEQPAPAGPKRVILTYHHAVLDGRSVRLLMRAFARAYLAEGGAVGGERRPDVRDHLRWLAGQDRGAARAFWAGAAPQAGSATLPPGGGGAAGVRTTARLAPYEASLLRDWAAGQGVTESTALQAAWALQLRRSVPAGGPVQVAFATAVSGRGIPLDGASRLPGPLRTALPMAVEVDPEEPVSRLLSALADRALDLAAYEWVSMGQVREWSGRGPEAPLAQSVLSFAPPPTTDADPLDEDLAAQGIRLTEPEAVATPGGHALSLTAHHDREGGLVLTGVHDRSGLADAREAVHHTARLLRGFPTTDRRSTTVADTLRLLGPWPPLAAAPPPAAAPLPPPAAVRPAGRTPRPGAARLVVLRQAARRGAGVVVLVPPPGAPAGCFSALARIHPWEGQLAALDGPVDAVGCGAALRPVLAAGEPLVLGCHAGGAPLAHEIARRVAAFGWPAPVVAVAADAASLSRALTAAAAR